MVIWTKSLRLSGRHLQMHVLRTKVLGFDSRFQDCGQSLSLWPEFPVEVPPNVDNLSIQCLVCSFKHTINEHAHVPHSCLFAARLSDRYPSTQRCNNVERPLIVFRHHILKLMRVHGAPDCSVDSMTFINDKKDMFIIKENESENEVARYTIISFLVSDWKT